MNKKSTNIYILFSVLILLVSSCGAINKTVLLDDYNDHRVSNNAVIFREGWGNDSHYPINVYLSTQIRNEDPTLVKQIQKAIDTWNNTIGKKILILNSDSNTKKGNNFSNLYSVLYTGINGLYYDKVENNEGGWLKNTGKSENTIATTVYNDDGTRITSASIRFNRDHYKFGDTLSDRNDNDQYIVDMESVSLHELGHFLGLGHANDEPTSVMYPTLNIGPNSENFPTTVRCLSPNDIMRIRSIYLHGASQTQIACVN